MTKPRDNSAPSRKDRLRYELQRNKKKTLLMLALLLVALGMGARLTFKKTPAKASAAEAIVPATSAPTLIAPVAPAPRVAAVSARVEGPTASSVPGPSRAAPVMPPTAEFLRDLFKPNLQHFPDALKEADAAKTAPGPRDIERRILKEAEALHLTSTMMGHTPCATINGQILRLNDRVGEFQIVAITHRTCDLVKKGIQVRIEMDR